MQATREYRSLPQFYNPRFLTAMKNNPLLARNAVAYWLAESARSNGFDTTSYRFAIESNDPDFLVSLTKMGTRCYTFKKQPAEQIEDGHVVEKDCWHLVLNDLALPLPSVQDFDLGTLYPSDELVMLFQLREKLIDEISSYHLTTTLSEQENRVLSLMILAP